ncbi:MAG: TIGR03086 family metal-binding protein [Acidimicrobiales bacterium]
MSTQPYEQAVAATRSVLAGVQADQLDADTPCAAWDVSELINHIVGGQHFFLAGMTGTPPTGGDTDYAAGDYVAAFDEATGAALAAFAEEGALQRTVSLPFGDMPGMAVMGLASTDTFQHGWDLAKATGQSTDLAPELAGSLLQQSKMAIQDSFRGPEGAPFGPEQSCADDACKADQLAAFLGRSI